MRACVIIPDYYHLYEQSVLKFADWFAVAWATDEEKEMIFAVKLPAHNNLANCSFRLGTQPSAEPYPGPVHDAGCSAPCTMHHAPCTMHHAPCYATQATISTPWCTAPACSSTSLTTSRRSTAAEPARSPPPPSPLPSARTHTHTHTYHHLQLWLPCLPHTTFI